MIERVVQAQPLVEVLLRFRHTRGYSVVMIAEISVQRHGRVAVPGWLPPQPASSSTRTSDRIDGMPGMAPWGRRMDHPGATDRFDLKLAGRRARGTMAKNRQNANAR